MGEMVALVLTLTGAAIAVLTTIALGAGYVKRLGAKSAAGQLSAEEVDAIRARLDALEQREEETEERVDFVERALSQSREATRLRNPSEKQ